MIPANTVSVVSKLLAYKSTSWQTLCWRFAMKLRKFSLQTSSTASGTCAGATGAGASAGAGAGASAGAGAGAGEGASAGAGEGACAATGVGIGAGGGAGLCTGGGAGAGVGAGAGAGAVVEVAADCSFSGASFPGATFPGATFPGASFLVLACSSALLSAARLLLNQFVTVSTGIPICLASSSFFSGLR